MSVNVAPIFTAIQDEEVKNLVSSHEESIRKVIRNLNYLGNAQPLGTIKFVNVNQPGVPPVDVNMYQYCDGSEITSPTSPLRTIGLNLSFTPNLVDLFPRGAPTDTGNPTGGTNAWNLAHSHGDFTGGQDANGSINGEGGDERKSNNNHSHPIDSDLSDQIVDAPAHVGMAPFMKIK